MRMYEKNHSIISHAERGFLGNFISTQKCLHSCVQMRLSKRTHVCIVSRMCLYESGDPSGILSLFHMLKMLCSNHPFCAEWQWCNPWNVANRMYLYIGRATFSIYTKTLFFFTRYQNHDSHRTIEVFQIPGKLHMLWATACGVAGCRHVCTVTADSGFAYRARSNTLVKFDSHVPRNEQNTKIQILNSQGSYIVCTSGIILVFKAGCVHPFAWPRFFTHSQKTRHKKYPHICSFSSSIICFKYP